MKFWVMAKKETRKTYVSKVWCKCCAKYTANINNGLKGLAKKIAITFVEGKTAVTNFQVSFQRKEYLVMLSSKHTFQKDAAV